MGLYYYPVLMAADIYCFLAIKFQLGKIKFNMLNLHGIWRKNLITTMGILKLPEAVVQKIAKLSRT